MYKDQSTVDFAREQFDLIKQGAKTQINQEMKSKIFYIIGRLGDDFEALKELHAKSNMPAEKNILERAIGHARSEKSIDQGKDPALFLINSESKLKCFLLQIKFCKFVYKEQSTFNADLICP